MILILGATCQNRAPLPVAKYRCSPVGYGQGAHHKGAFTMDAKNNQNFVEMEDGRRFPIVSISLTDLNLCEIGIKADYKARGEPIDPPEVQVEIAGGGTIPYQLTAQTLEIPGNLEETERRKVAWAKHIDAVERMEFEITQAKNNIILDGLSVELPADDGWIRRRERRGIRIPQEIKSDPDALLEYYKKHEIIKTVGDFVRVQKEIMLISSSGVLKRDKLDAASDAYFREIQNIADGGTDTSKRTSRQAKKN